MAILSRWQQLTVIEKFDSDNSLEMYAVVHQGNKAYVPEATNNMTHNVQDHS